MEKLELLKKVLIVEDHSLVRKGVIMLLENSGMEVEGAENGAVGLKILSNKKFDLVITDLEMPVLNGFDFTKEVKRLYPDQKLVVLTMHEEIVFVKNLIELGIDGYLHKNIEPTELILAIKKVLAGKTYFTQEISSKLIQDMIVKKRKNQIAQTLSERELDILRLLIDENTVADIADKLSISPRTVENHKSNIMEKFGAKTMIGLVKKAYDQKLI
jgi:DNA-binding NarL/FixJ family response regulator